MWRLKSGEEVVDRFRSHLHSTVAPLLPDALARVEGRERQFLVEEVDFGRIVGQSTCVATGPGDEIVFAQRPGRWGLTRFIKNRQPEPTTSVVVILKTAAGKGHEGKYVLVTAFLGRKAEPEPWDPRATAASRDFWGSHALIWGSEPIVPGTETIVCPW